LDNPINLDTTTFSSEIPADFDLDVDRMIAMIESILAPRSLSIVQVQIIRGAIVGKSYKEIAAVAKPDLSVDQTDPVASEIPLIDKRGVNSYQVSYIKETGAQLWQSLSQKLGAKVTKKSLAAVILWYSKQPEFKDADDRDILTTSVANPTNVHRIPPDRGMRTQRPILPIEIDRFYGRTEELTTLTTWCLYDNCRLIFLVGMGGMGKTTLAGETMRQLKAYFDRTIWRSLVNLPPVAELCTDLLQCFNPDRIEDLPSSLDGQIELLIACFKRDRCLLVLDNVESILEGQVQSGQYLTGYEDYDRLFRAISELPHQSCVLLTSREKPHTIAKFQIVNPQLVRSMMINGMMSAAAYQLVQSYGCPQLPEQMWQEVYDHYGGNPLALKVATIAAVELTGGGEKMLELYPLMQQGKLQFRDIDDVLRRQFERLSPIEQQLVCWLTISRTPVTGTELRANSVLKACEPGEIINALQSLSRRCVTICHDRDWSIQPVMMNYVTNRLINQLATELGCDLASDPAVMDLPSWFYHLNTYEIVQLKASDHLRQIQIKTILRPVLDRATTAVANNRSIQDQGKDDPGSSGTNQKSSKKLTKNWHDPTQLHDHLRQILGQWQALDPIPSGYLVENILNLTIELTRDCPSTAVVQISHLDLENSIHPRDILPG
jgi:NB-ARC domain